MSHPCYGRLTTFSAAPIIFRLASCSGLTGESVGAGQPATDDLLPPVAYEGGAPDHFTYRGREQEDDGGFLLLPCRSYDPIIGGWAEQVPLRCTADDANLYRYVGGGPASASGAGIDGVAAGAGD